MNVNVMSCTQGNHNCGGDSNSGGDGNSSGGADCLKL